MGDASYSQCSFLSGEWGKYAQGRFDLPDYRKALNTCVNAYPLEQGSWARRPGTQFAGLTRGGQAGREIDFDFKQDVPYVLEFTAGYLRARVGPNWVTTNDDQSVTAISTAVPAKVTTAGVNNWSTGNCVLFANLGTACPLLQNRQFNITVTDPTNFTLTDAITGTAIDGSVLGTLPASATVKRILEVVTPYTGTLWRDVRLLQNEMTAILLHPTIPPQLLTASVAPPSLTALPPPAGVTTYTFTLARANILDGPYLDPPSNGAILTPSATAGIISVALSFTAYASSRAYSVGDFVNYSAVNYRSIADQNQGNQPDVSPTKWEAVSAGEAIGPNGFVGTDVGRLIRMKDSANNWTWGKITGIGTMIDPGLLGSVAIGNMSLGGGLAAAFDGVTVQTAGHSAVAEGVIADPVSGFVGKNYVAATPQKIASATFWPSSDLQFVFITKTYTTSTDTYQWTSHFPAASSWDLTSHSAVANTVVTSAASITVNLRASMTAPASASDGTLLATSSSFVPTVPLTLISTDQTTAWNYIWFEIVASAIDTSVPGPVDTRPLFPTFGQIAYTQVSVLNSFTTTLSVAEVQFFSPPGTGTGNSANVQVLGNDLASTAALGSFRLGVYSDTTGWPTCGTFHEGRLWLAGSVSNRVDSSRSNAPLIFSPTNADGTVVDSNGISAVFNSPDVNAIFWMVPDHLGIIVGTQAGPWLVQASANNNPLTPTSMQAHRYSKIGCANIEPRRADHVLVMVQRFKRKLFEHFPDVYSGKFAAQNITWASQHVTKSGIAEIAYQHELAPIIWARCSDGSLFGITYKRDSNVSAQPPNFAAAHRHTLGGGRTVESISVGPSTDGNLDSLTMVTNDASTGLRHVEIMTTLFEEGAADDAAWFLDDAVIPSSSEVSGDTFVVNGLWHLNNKLATVYAGGLDCGEWPVTNGSITMTFGDGISAGTGSGLFTADFVASFDGDMPLVVGFTYTSQGQLVRPATPQESGARNGPALGKTRRSHQVAMLLDRAAGISLGTSFDDLRPALFKTEGNKPYAAGRLFSGVYHTTLENDYSYDSMPCWEVTRPYPATVAAVEAFLSTQDR